MRPDFVVTGSTGFIGTHLCERLIQQAGQAAVYGLDIVNSPTPRTYSFSQTDICDRTGLEKIQSKPGSTMFHLAAKAEVVIPFNELTELTNVNINGTINVLDIMKPEKVIFASSSAVYGTVKVDQVSPSWDSINPIGTYGMTKAMGELILKDWAQETGGNVAMFRFGNVIGKNCRGFIPYLVRHAKQYPDGSVPAQARGRGKIVRDYVPVDYTVAILMAAMAAEWKPGTAEAFNIGGGKPMTNSEVAVIVQRILKQKGYELTINWENPIPPGESKVVVLDVDNTVRKFGIPAPSYDEVVDTIEMAVLSHL
jgi:UDP-glucose 4-epimerase